MDNSTLIIVILVIVVILIWNFISNSDTKEAPNFNDWAFKKNQRKPSLSIEELFNEYIDSYDVLTRKTVDEPQKVSLARTKLNLINKYSIDKVFKGNNNYEAYKMSLITFVEYYDRLSPYGKERYKKKTR